MTDLVILAILSEIHTRLMLISALAHKEDQDSKNRLNNELILLRWLVSDTQRLIQSK